MYTHVHVHVTVCINCTAGIAGCSLDPETADWISSVFDVGGVCGQ